MAVTATIDSDGRFVRGNRVIRQGSINLGTYAAGGVAVTPGNVELNVLQNLSLEPAAGYVYSWNRSTGKVQAFSRAARARLSRRWAPIDLSTFPARFSAEGF
jgi:hypothetical protein